MTGKEKKRLGKPRKEINTDQLYKLAQSLLTVEKIADILDCHRDTIYANYSDVLQKGRANRIHSLVEAMWHKALVEKDCKMQIWLSKQHLGYKDHQPEETPTNNFHIHINDVP